MKTKQRFFKAVLLCVFTICIISCKKNDDEPIPLSWNYSTFTDSRDGKIYNYIKIGTQEWMAENLVFNISGSWNAGYTEADAAKYGRLYTWDAAKKAVPAGWHLPTDEEWKKLEMTLGMSQSEADKIDSRGTNEGSKLKAQTGWGKEVNGLDQVGFNALPGGIRVNSGSFFASDWEGYWWSSTSDINSRAWMRYLKYDSKKVFRNTSFTEDACSVRCVKD